MNDVKSSILCGGCWFREGRKMCDGDNKLAINAYLTGECFPTGKRAKRAALKRIKLWKKLDRLTGRKKAK